MNWRAALAWGWTLVILILCWTPRSYLGSEDRPHRAFAIPHLDKLVHLGIFAIFSLSWARTSSQPAIARIALAGLALAVVTELGQATPVVNRDATLGDGLADTLGVLVGLGIAVLLARFRQPSPQASGSIPRARS